MQSNTPAARTKATSKAASTARRIASVSWKPALFAVLMWVSAAAGEIPVPGTPVPITLQTFVVMLAGLMLTWRQAGSAVAAYLAAGALGLPVFAGGTSTMALLGPSAGFLIGFLPGVVVIALAKGRAAQRGESAARTLLTALRYFAAAILGGVGVVYLFGVLVQSALTGAPILAVTIASMAFIIGDVVKAFVAAAVAAGLARLR